MLLASLVPGDRPPRPAGTDLLLLPLSATFFSCLVERASATIFPVRPDGRRIVEPRKVHNVNPEYPHAALAQRRQGVVILEALLSPTGCVRSVEVLRGVAPDLDAEALRAVTHWRYTPTLLDGAPVPVHMTVTVNFKLR
jgi:TonB family protein